MDLTPDVAPSTLAAWAQALAARGLTVLPSSYVVPVELWLRAADGGVLHVRARGARVTLRVYDASALGAVLVRAECDCEEHRTAGAVLRTTVLPAAVPVAEFTHDGDGLWTSYEAGLLTVAQAAPVVDALLDRWNGARDRGALVA